MTPVGPALRHSDRILVVEDEPAVRQVIQWALEAEGFEVETAGNGHEALDKAREREPSLVLLDLELPELEGETVAQRLRQRCGDVPIVVTTVGQVMAGEAQGTGAVDHLTKPFHRGELIDAVQRALARLEVRKEA